MGTVSDKALSGARSHRVMLDQCAVEEALDSIVGMGVSFHRSLEKHDTKRQIGVVEDAEIDGETLRLSGYLYYAYFKKEIDSLGEGLGVSYEIAKARITNTRADVWTVNAFFFTGIAIIKRSKAAYANSSFEVLERTLQSNE